MSNPTDESRRAALDTTLADRAKWLDQKIYAASCATDGPFSVTLSMAECAVVRELAALTVPEADAPGEALKDASDLCALAALHAHPTGEE